MMARRKAPPTMVDATLVQIIVIAVVGGAFLLAIIIGR